MPTIECFRTALKERFHIAAENKWSRLIVRSGPLHNDVRVAHNVNPTEHNCMPTCCDAMWEVKSPEDTVIVTPP